jgi:hypothetical protein
VWALVGPRPAYSWRAWTIIVEISAPAEVGRSSTGSGSVDIGWLFPAPPLEAAERRETREPNDEGLLA